MRFQQIDQFAAKLPADKRKLVENLHKDGDVLARKKVLIVGWMPQAGIEVLRKRDDVDFEVLPLTGGDRPVGTVLQERLRDNKVVCLLADRDLGSGGLRVDFFGERTTLPAGPVLLAQSTGAALLPADCFFTEDGWGLHFQSPVDVHSGRRELLAAAQNLADRLADGIAKHPADWHMTQPLWTADR